MFVRKEKEEKGRIKDVIGGWGGESERALRKVAQRGGTSYAPAILTHTNINDSDKTVQCDSAGTSASCCC